MDPLRVAVGIHEPVGEAASRMSRHQAPVAPVVSNGVAVSLLAEATARAAVRILPAPATTGDVASGPASSVGAEAGLPSLWRASKGTAPGVLVRGAGGTVRGLACREAVERAVRRARAATPRAKWLDEPDVGARLQRLLDPPARDLLGRAGALASRRRVAVWLVGGIVRDVMRGAPGRDPDLVVEGDAIDFAAALGASMGIRVVSHPAFGTAELRLASGEHVDVITARRERYPEPGALPLVEPSHLEDDLRRRDVTINAMAIRLDGRSRGRLRDDLAGRRDLRAGLLRVHHALSIVDDPTRAFRVARLAARLGFDLAEETRRSLELARRARAADRVSGARLWREFRRVATEPDPPGAIGWLARLGLLEWLGPGLAWGSSARRCAAALAQARERIAPPWEEGADAMMLLAITARGATRRQKESLAARLSLQGKAAAWLIDSESMARGLQDALGRASRPSAAARALDRHDSATVAMAWILGDTATRRWIAALAPGRRPGAPGVDGHVLRSLGLRPGPAYARILGLVEEAWLDGRLRDPEQAMAMTRRLVRKEAGGPAAAGALTRKGGR